MKDFGGLLRLVVLVWLVLCVYFLCRAEQVPVYEPVEVEEDGRLPGDDVPATERCYLTEEEQEDFENELIEAALLAKANVIEDCTITYYCCEKYEHICGTGDGITYTGTEVYPGRSCAVDPTVIPFGATVMVDYGDGEIHYYVAEDIGLSITGSRIDLAVATHSEALQMGTKTATVYWTEE